MATQQALDLVQRAYIAYYQRPADYGGLHYWAGRLDQEGGNLNGIIDAFANSPEAQSLYDGVGNTAKVTQVYQALFNRGPDQGGLDYYTGELAAGRLNLQTIALNILDGAQNDDALIIANKVTTAHAFSNQLATSNAAYSTGHDVIEARTYLTGVTADSSTVMERQANLSQWMDRIAFDDNAMHGTSTADQITGNYSSSNVIYGYAGNDTIYGGSKADYIDAGEGDDSINAFGGLDTVYGGDGNDTFTNLHGQSEYTYDPEINQNVYTYTYAQVYDGAGDDNVGAGNALAFIEVHNGAGNDTVYLHTGSIFHSGPGNDTVSGGSGAFLDYGTAVLSGSQGISLVLPYVNSATIDPGSSDAGQDVLSGSFTKVIGSAGNDTLSLGERDATVVGGSGDDVLDGGTYVRSYDWLDYSSATLVTIGSTRGITLTLPQGDLTSTLDAGATDAGQDTIYHFGSVTGTAYNDTLTGNTASNNLYGGSGNDTLSGNAGDDTLIGGEGNDSLSGGDGGDRIIGGLGNDTLTGGSGYDFFYFIFPGDTSTDRITDFNIPNDTLYFSRSNLGMEYSTYNEGTADGLKGNGNVIVLTEGFASMDAAAAAIAANPLMTATGVGVFVYYDTSTQIAKVVQSTNLNNDGTEHVIVEILGVSLANMADFSSSDLSFYS